MAQDKIKIGTSASNLIEIKQPDEDMGYSFESTYTQDSTRVLSGKARFTALFTVESLQYNATNVSVSEMSAILQIIAKGKNFVLHYWSPFYGTWRNDWFYVGKGSLNIGQLSEDGEYYSSLQFNMIGVNAL